ncbi:MAG: hypothetical protein DWQ37_07675 [Planctomycetota bacterium]|nr:MAG: hypothetical protein DWQ37_07675 [Planctomycetota bacterium]
MGIRIEEGMSSYRCWVLVAICLTGLVPAGRARATEPVDAFLSALRERQYYDLADAYLEQLRTSPHVDDAFRERIGYERAVTLLSEAREQNDPRRRRTKLAEATERFEQFCREQPEHDLAGSARAQLADILLERGRSEMLASKPEDRDPAAARKLYEEARKQFAAAAEQIDAQLGEMPKLVPDDDRELQSRKWKLAADLAEARLLQAGIDFEVARTYEPDSKQAKQHYTAAAKSYAALHETYRTRAVGLLARLWEGRCHQELGAFQQALGCFRQLLDVPDSNEMRSIKTKATRHALECWTSDQVKQYQAAIERGELWQKESGQGVDGTDAQAIRYLTAVAYEKQAGALPAGDPNRKRLTSSAREHVSPIAKQPGAFQRPAKTLLVALAGGGAAAQAAQQDAEPKTFAEAMEQARQALALMQDASASVTAAQSKGDAVAVEKLEAQRQAGASRAIHLLRLAMQMADNETPIEELNTARHYLCFACWETERYYDAAVLGEFLAKNFPDSLAGRQGAKIAMASWVRLYGESEAEDRSFEIQRIQKIAEVIFQRWPDQQEAEDAALTLVNFAAAAQSVEQAVSYLDKIPEDSPRRGQAELRAGQALWSTYLRSLRMPEGERPSGDKLEALRTQAEQVLTRGIGRLDKSDQIDATLATAVFSLAQIYVETDQPEKAIEWLTHPRFGPLTLVEKKHAAAQRPGFAVETYKMALRAFIAATPQQLDKAQAAMNSLEELVKASGDEGAAESLTAIYISLGRQLQQNLESLRKSGKNKEVERISKAFEVFLDRVAKQPGNAGFATLNWIGETYYGLASSLDTDGPGVSLTAQSYFEKAAGAYEPMLEMAANDPKYSEKPDTLIAVQLRLADCYGRAGKLDRAVDVINDVLAKKPSLLTAQVKAAEILQASGNSDPTGYVKAIQGAEPNRQGRNKIWGWAKISQLTHNKPQFVETFHLARRNIAEARLGYATSQDDAERRRKVLEAGIGDLWSTYRSDRALGGPETAAQYDQVLKKMQKALGEEPLGLEEFKKRDEQAAAASG